MNKINLTTLFMSLLFAVAFIFLLIVAIVIIGILCTALPYLPVVVGFIIVWYIIYKSIEYLG